MTQTNPFGVPDDVMSKTFDPAHAANTIGSLLSILGGGGASGDSQSLTSGGTAPTTPEDTMAAADATATAGTNTGDFGHPVGGELDISQPYGGTNNHPGIDIGVGIGTPVLAATDGVVTHAASDDPNGYGTWVEVTAPDGIVTRYGHLSGLNVTDGQKVGKGQLLGPSGSTGNATGPHLHFEVRINGNTVNPAPYLAGGYQVIGEGQASPASDMGTTVEAPDPQEIAAAQVGNTADILAGRAPSHTPPGSKTKAGKKLGGATSGADGDAGSVDAFLNATKQHESGGDYTIYNQSGLSNASGAYQFVGSTWKSWGGTTASAAEASPAEQDAVARRMATALFEKYHSWRLVAIAWYGGPGIADQVAAGQDPGSPDQQGGYLAYGDTIASMMSGK